MHFEMNKDVNKNSGILDLIFSPISATIYQFHKGNLQFYNAYTY